MAKKHKHEDHTNHEAWAIPYGDLVTLLLALFVVMYSMSAINEGKFRVASDSLNAAFGGKPRSPTPIQIGPKALSPPSDPRPRVLPGAAAPEGIRGPMQSLHRPDLPGLGLGFRASGDGGRETAVGARARQQLDKMSEKVYDALGDLIARKQVIVRRHEEWLEIAIQTDILYASGSAQLGNAAGAVLDRLADVLKSFDNRLRIEGHTDDVPIATREFPSNWELSSARAASVVHRFMACGVEPRRMTVEGLGEYKPVAENVDAASRNRNRRVVVVVMANPGEKPPSFLVPTSASAAVEPGPSLSPPLPPAGAPVASTVVAAREHAEP